MQTRSRGPASRRTTSYSLWMKGCLRSQRSTSTKKMTCLTTANALSSLRNNRTNHNLNQMTLKDLTLFSWKMRTTMRTTWIRHTWFSNRSTKRDITSQWRTISRRPRLTQRWKKWKMQTTRRRACTSESACYKGWEEGCMQSALSKNSCI